MIIKNVDEIDVLGGVQRGCSGNLRGCPGNVGGAHVSLLLIYSDKACGPVFHPLLGLA